MCVEHAEYQCRSEKQTVCIGSECLEQSSVCARARGWHTSWLAHWQMCLQACQCAVSLVAYG